MMRVDIAVFSYVSDLHLKPNQTNKKKTTNQKSVVPENSPNGLSAESYRIKLKSVLTSKRIQQFGTSEIQNIVSGHFRGSLSELE